MGACSYGENGCQFLFVCTRACARGCVKINKCGSLVGRKHLFLASLINPPVKEYCNEGVLLEPLCYEHPKIQKNAP